MGTKFAKEQDRTESLLQAGALNVAVGTSIADEGMNIPILSRGFGCTPAAGNSGRFTQQIGRFKRIHEGKKDAVYYYFWDRRIRGIRGHLRTIFNLVKQPHRVWYSEQPGERELLTRELINTIEGKKS